jgi:hypothetical protein
MHRDRLATLECMQGKAKIGEELVVTTRSPGTLTVNAGNYGEQITSFSTTGDGAQVTWKSDNHSVITVALY